MKKFGKRNARRGFTLIELLAATAIMIVLVLFVTNIAVNMLRIYDRTVATLATNADSGILLDAMQEDLLSASMPDDGNTWFEVRYESDVGNIAKESAPELMFFARPQDRIRRSRSSTETLPGDLCAVSYKLAHLSPFGSRVSSSSAGNLVYGTYRAVLNAEDTFEFALPYVIGQKGDSSSSKLPSRFWKGGDQIEDPSDQKKYSASAWRTEMQNFLVDGIVDVSVFFWFDDFTDGERKIAVVNNSKIVQRLRVCLLQPAGDLKFHVTAVEGVVRLCVDQAHAPGVEGIPLLGGEHLDEQNLTVFETQVIHRFAPVAVGKEIGDDNAQPVPLERFRPVKDRLPEICFAVKGNAFKIADCAEKARLSDDEPVRIVCRSAADEIIGKFVHVMHGKEPEGCRERRRVVCLLRVCPAHGRRTVEIYLRVHLPFVCEQLQKVLFKTAVQIPVDAADVVSQHVFAVIGKFHRLSVCFHEMLSAEEAVQIAPQIERARLQAAEKFIVYVFRGHLLFSE